MSKTKVKIDDIKECADQALFFLKEMKRIGEENTIYKNASIQFINNIVRITKDGRDSIQPTPTDKST
jgi:hypothetical protein